MTLVVAALAWLASIAAVALWGMPSWLVGALVACFVPLTWLLRGRQWAGLVAILALVSLVGGARFASWDHREPPSLAGFVGQEVVLDGVVESEPVPAATTTAFVVRVEQIETDGRSVTAEGKLRASLAQYTDYLPGTRLRLSGVLDDPPVFADFDYRSYLARQGIVATMYLPTVDVVAGPSRWSATRNIMEARLALDRALQRALPEPEAALAGGIAFGRDGAMPDDLYGDFRDVGLAHIVAVSGSNVSLVAALTFALFTWLVGRRFAMIPAAVSVLGYLAVAGLSGSVTRAGIMAMVYLLGAFLGRQRSALAALGAAVIVMTLYQPGAARDVGFQLSLAATAGLIVFGPWIRAWLAVGTNRLRAHWLPQPVIEVAALSASATFATLPLVWINFGRVSVIGPLANILIEPLFVVVFWLSMATAIAGLVWGPAGWALGLAAYYPLSFITWFARDAANIPFAAVDVPAGNGSVALVAYGGLCAVGWLAYRRYAPTASITSTAGPAPRLSRTYVAVAAAGVLGCAVIPVSLWPLRGPGELSVDVLNVSSGDALLVTTPSGRHVLVDGGFERPRTGARAGSGSPALGPEDRPHRRAGRLATARREHGPRWCRASTPAPARSCTSATVSPSMAWRSSASGKQPTGAARLCGCRTAECRCSRLAM